MEWIIGGAIAFILSIIGAFTVGRRGAQKEEKARVAEAKVRRAQRVSDALRVVRKQRDEQVEQVMEEAADAVSHVYTEDDILEFERRADGWLAKRRQ
jgi:hypothetical protein